MKICYYDSRTFIFYETFYAHIMLLPGIILGDSFVISLDDNWWKLVMEDIDTWSSEKILTTFKEVFELDFNALALIHDYEEKRKELKEIVPKMHNAKKITMLKHSISCLKKEFKPKFRNRK